MALTTAQLQAIKADIIATPYLAGLPNTSDGDYDRAVYYNSIATPDFIVWRTNVPQDEIMQNGFDWVQVDNLSVGKARIWEWLFDNSQRVFNPSKANVRAGIDECWKGTAAMLAVRDAVYVHCKRQATRLEKLLATGTGTTLDPALLTFEGVVTYADIQQARTN